MLFLPHDTKRGQNRGENERIKWTNEHLCFEHTFTVKGEEEEEQARDEVTQESDDSTGDAFRDRVHRLNEQLEEYRNTAVNKNANQDAGSVQDCCENREWGRISYSLIGSFDERRFQISNEQLNLKKKKKMPYWSTLWNSSSDLFHLPQLRTLPFAFSSTEIYDEPSS